MMPELTKGAGKRAPQLTPSQRLFWVAGLLLMMAADQLLAVGLQFHRAPLHYDASILTPRTSVAFHITLLSAVVVAQIGLLWAAVRRDRRQTWLWALVGGAVSVAVAALYVFVLI